MVETVQYSFLRILITLSLDTVHYKLHGEHTSMSFDRLDSRDLKQILGEVQRPPSPKQNSYLQVMKFSSMYNFITLCINTSPDPTIYVAHIRPIAKQS